MSYIFSSSAKASNCPVREMSSYGLAKIALFVICGDYDIYYCGHHSGSSPGETSHAQVFMSPSLDYIELEKRLDALKQTHTSMLYGRYHAFTTWCTNARLAVRGALGENKMASGGVC